MTMPGRNYTATNQYRYGFNGKEKDADMDGNNYDYGFRIYNPQIGRFLSIDPFEKHYPWNSPYDFAENDPINYIDLDGLEKAKKLVNMDHSVFTQEQVYNSIIGHPDHVANRINNKGTAWTLGAREYSFIVTYEGLSKKMYDNDGDKSGNATIGFGHLIHEGAIGNNEVNKKLEEPFKDGISYEDAISLLIRDIKASEQNVNRYLNSAGISDQITGRQFTALTDLAFNMGQSRAFKIVNIIKTEGWAAAIKQINKWTPKYRRHFEAVLASNGGFMDLEHAQKETESPKKNKAAKHSKNKFENKKIRS